MLLSTYKETSDFPYRQFPSNFTGMRCGAAVIHASISSDVFFAVRCKYETYMIAIVFAVVIFYCLPAKIFKGQQFFSFA